MARSRRKPGRRCPICDKPVMAAGPFCSPRCADADLAKWLGEGYRVPTNEPTSELLDGRGAAPDQPLDRDREAD